MIDNNKYVYKCLICKREFVGDMTVDTKICPFCTHVSQDGNPILVIEGNLIVKK